MRFFRWLYPGMRVKRWLALFVVGLVLTVAGFAAAADARLLAWVEEGLWRGAVLLGGPFSPVARGLALATLGLGLALYAVHRLTTSVVRSVMPGAGGDLGQMIYQKLQLGRGPRVVVLGGGTGLPILLRGLKEYTRNTVAIVTVADDGGSSGRLRDELGVPPVGDIRNCLVALADTEPLMERLFQHRFTSGTLKGHSLGNLFIAALSEVLGDFEEAVRESSKVLAVRGQVLPSSVDPVRLGAEMEDGAVVRGETAVGSGHGRIRRVFLEPADCRPPAEALGAIRDADLVVLGPGSLFTSVIPHLLNRPIADALRRTRAPVVCVLNLMTQPGETDGFSATDQVRAIIEHAGPGIVDIVLHNTSRIAESRRNLYEKKQAFPVTVDPSALRSLGVKVVGAPLLTPQGLVRHAPAKLAAALLEQIAEGRRHD
jgi:uncharacterized cofD-like protein